MALFKAEIQQLRNAHIASVQQSEQQQVPPREKRAPTYGVCYNCGQPSHLSHSCPEPLKGGQGCFNCSQRGHISCDCPEPPKPRLYGKGAAQPRRGDAPLGLPPGPAEPPPALG